MKKLFKYMKIMTAAMLVLSLGILIGSKLEQIYIEQENGNQSNTTKIAIVNLDEGTQYQGEQRNFANEIMGEESENFVITGLEDAKNGTKDARYAAYVVLPSNFSQTITTINTIPEKSVLKYEISGNLSEEANDKAWQNVMMLKEKLNDDIGYMYISSILSEFHDGQNNALKVISNDTKDKEVLMAISNYDLVSTLDLKEVERLQNDIADLDINPDVAINQQIIASVDTAYKAYLSDTSNEILNLKGESSNLTVQNEEVLNVGSAIKNLVNDDGTRNYETKESLAFMQNFNQNLMNGLQTIVKDIDEKVDGQDTNKDDYVTNQTSKFDDLIDSMQTNHNSLNKKQLASLKDSITTLIAEDIKKYAFDWKNFSDVEKVLEDSKAKEITSNAIGYIDKLIIIEFSKYNYGVKDVALDTTYFDKIMEAIIKNNENNDKLKESLKIYALSIGKIEDEAVIYSLDDYVKDNVNVLDTYPEIDTTANSDLLYADIETALTTNSTALIETCLDAIGKSIESKIDTIGETDIEEATKDTITTYKEVIKNVPIADFSTIKSSITDVGQLNTDEAVNKIHVDLVALSDEQKKNKINLLETIQIHNVSNALFHEAFMAYDPLKSIDDKEIEGFVKEFGRNNNRMQYKIEDKNREYTSFVSESYRNANDHIRSMKDDVKSHQMQSDEKVTKGLENAKIVRTETAALNNGLMINYINKLPYTRIGTVGNTSVYDFVTKPSEMEGDKILGNSLKDNHNPMLYIVGFSAILSIVCICITTYSKTVYKRTNL